MSSGGHERREKEYKFIDFICAPLFFYFHEEKQSKKISSFFLFIASRISN